MGKGQVLVQAVAKKIENDKKFFFETIGEGGGGGGGGRKVISN